MKKILITGSTGFIGRNLKEQLKGYELLTPTHKKLDLEDETKVRDYFIKNEIDCIIHCANCEFVLPIQKNVRMLLNLIKYRTNLYNKIIYFGSGAEFQDTPYGISKKIMSEIAQQTPNVFNLRLYGVFGKYENPKRRFLSVCCNSILDKKPIEIWDNIKFSYIWVNDLVKIIDWFLNNNPRSKEYSFGGDTLYLSEWAETLMECADKKTEIIIYKNSKKSYSDDSKKNCLSPIQTSLKELYDYYKSLRSI